MRRFDVCAGLCSIIEFKYIKIDVFFVRINNYLTDVQYQDLLHVVVICQTGLQVREVLVILYHLVFPEVQGVPRFPFFLFCHLVREGPGDQLFQVIREGLVNL